MDIFGIGLGVVFLVIIGLVLYVAKHPPLTAQANGKDLANTVAAAGADAWEAVKRDLPTIVSAEVAQLRADKAALITRAEAAESALAAEVQASAARLAAVQSQVGALIAGIGALPANAVPIAAVEAAQAADAARVTAFAAEISPAQPALS